MSKHVIDAYLANLLAQANRQISSQLEEQFRAEGIPVEQWRVLDALREGQGHSMSELAEAVMMNLPTLTKTIDRMVSNALVYRTTDPADRRRVLVHVSDHGQALADRLADLARQHQSKIFARYGDKKAASLRRLLEGLIEDTR